MRPSRPTIGAVGSTEGRRKSGEMAAEIGLKAGDWRNSVATLQACILPRREIQGGVSMADAREVMNIRQASQYLGVSPDTLYKYVSEEKIPAFKLGNRWKFKKSILDTWMENKSLSGEVSRPRKLTKTARVLGS